MSHLRPCYAPSQVLVELDSALLDDQPHWYKLQLHDVSSLPLPNASPYLQRRVLPPEDTLSSRRLQSTIRTRTYRHAHTTACCIYDFLFVDFLLYFFHHSYQTKVRSITQVITPVPVGLAFPCCSRVSFDLGCSGFFSVPRRF